jgi:long-chain acyl-CoA synthetase
MDTKPWLKFYEKNVPHHLTYPNHPLDAIVSQAARSHPDHCASNFVLKYIAGGYIPIGGRLTYQELDEHINRFATALYQLGVRKGDRVGIMLPNSPQFLISLFGVLRVGAIGVTINPTYTSRELKYQLDDSGAETLVLLNLFWPRLREIQPTTPLKRVVVAHIFDTLPLPANLLVQMSQRRDKAWVTVKPEHDIFFFEHLLKKYAPTPPAVAVTPTDLALFQYTGGTTGIPKAAMLTHRNLVANLNQVSAWINDSKRGQEKVMGVLPFFHAYGMMGALYALNMASELVMVPSPRPLEHVMDVIQKERCTVFPGVPALYLNIINHPAAHTYDLRSVRACISGAATLPREVQRRFEELTGGRLVEGYGLSEAAPVTHCNPFYGLRKPGIGMPVSDVEAKLVDVETGEDLPIDTEQSGELCVRGPQIMKGYWNRPEETASTIDSEGWMHTGDICTVDRDGFFRIVDRKKDMIIASGYKVLPRDVEEVLFMHPKVQEAVVVGVPNPERGDDTVKAYIVPRTENTPTSEEILAFCKMHLAPYKLPREIEFRSELPKTLVGKVLRRVLVEEEVQRRAAASSA